MKGASTTPPLQVRIPDDLKQWLKHVAIDNRRSLNAEVVHRLEKSRAAEKQQPKR